MKGLTAFPAPLDAYYRGILGEYEAAYNAAEKAKSKGLDPNEFVESKTVSDLADRVDQMLGLTQFEGLGERLRELLHSTTKERATLTIAEEIALGKFGAMKTEQALDYAVRTGLAVVTDGVTVAPVQGIYSVLIRKNDDNSEYASISYAGPMRSAGGTEAAFSVLIGDFVAKRLGLSPYRAREEEVTRYIEELRIYEREVGNFQYRVTDDDVRTAIANLPVEIDGVETDPIEVVVHRNLKRVATDRLRGGALRVLNDGVIGRAHKLQKLLRELSLPGWDWLAELKGGKQESTNETEKAGAHFEEVISGRAVLSSHNAKGGFRIRYGRAVNTGLSAIGIHPAVPILLDYPVVAGTQVKVDLPGKGATITFVDSIEGPTVLLRDGSVVRINTARDAELLRDGLVRILDLGDALISYGDFLENNKTLQPSPYVFEWWIQDVQRRISLSPSDALGPDFLVSLMAGAPLTADEAIRVSDALNVPLDPRHAPRFDRLSMTDILELRECMDVHDRDVMVRITSHHVEETLRQLLVPYSRHNGLAVLSGATAAVMKRLLNLGSNMPDARQENPLELILALSGIRMKPQTTATVGMRVGRPEKAMLRHLKPPVHTLFPVGNSGGSTRDLTVAAKRGIISMEAANIMCPSCGKRRLSSRCQDCGEATVRFLGCPRCGRVLSQSANQACPTCKVDGITYSSYSFDLKSELETAIETVGGLAHKPIKGVRGLSSESKFSESLAKGVLRSKHDIYVYKDGTTRIDVTNAPLTHFRVSDVRGDIAALRTLGYDADYLGNPLSDVNQILELKPQDIIIPDNIATDLVRVAEFVDDELRTIYGLSPIYQVHRTENLLGRSVVGLAPHTSVGVLGRIVGFTNAQVCFANPCWHAAKRRDCDGDGDSLLLLSDVLLNFSVEYIPDQIGGLMDTPLLIQPIILPAEVDDQAHSFDIAFGYPLEFYEATLESPNPSKLAPLIDTIGKRLNNENQFYGYGFTHATSTITIKHSRSAYPTLSSLTEKISKQIEVAEKIDAVSAKDVVESIIKTHLLRDIVGNMKKYSTQSFRCRGCGRSFRRPTVSGCCDFCGENLRETLTRGSVEKYLTLAQRLAQEYNVEDYTKARLNLIVNELNQLFQNRDRSTQLELTDFVVAQ